ncbi:DUF6304 family protein [Planotetraspora kaengkrachanensis]|uniref:DUF6304 family protein n=1 Tax=Planotetraspora kaengkrachanensis TaxID=575193 RepID=UPI0019447015|nr:DUF6304 family protein [Planotetraspora kaengkrachanensis]
MTVAWDGWYRDRGGEERVSIRNDGHQLTVTIRGIEFTGSHLDDLEAATDLPDETAFTIDHGALCACELVWTIPIAVVADGAVVDGQLGCHLILGAPPRRAAGDTVSVLLEFGGSTYTAHASGWFEVALEALHRQVPRGTYTRTCIACAWSDYQPGGSPLFGGLACFRDAKDAYRRITTKHDMFEILPALTEWVQETHVCDQFERREAGVGYRGSFPADLGE